MASTSGTPAAVPNVGSHGHGFGTAPVFLASISTILGAVLFLRFGYAVGHTGLLGSLLIILLGHMVTIPTSMAIAEIATNRRVEGGGEYFIISRSFGTTIGASIGTALYLSQAISVAFYAIAFAEAFQPLAPWFEDLTGLAFDPRMVSLPGILILLTLIVFRGANIGVTALWIIAGVLAITLVLFFVGPSIEGTSTDGIRLLDRTQNPDPFFLVFAIVFPAFTGMTAGVGLSGDLANPRRSIPLGTMIATSIGMLTYVAIVFKLTASAPPNILGSDQLVMSRIALWGPIVPIGLACATVSSAIGSILVAPRTLQALANDEVVPWRSITSFFSRGHGDANEPRNATLITAVLAVTFVALGDVNFVARIISMFFMVTYGSLCAISFLEHFAARPSYRPTFRSKWYISLFGAIMCGLLMFQMDPVYAALSLLAMAGIYLGIRASRKDQGDDLGAIFRAGMIQATRHMQVRLQTSLPARTSEAWRPSVIMVNRRTFERKSPLMLLNWICYRHAVGTYLHYLKGPLDPEHYAESRIALDRLIDLAQANKSTVYVDTIVSPSMRSALAQSLQVPGISGMENNTAMFEFSLNDGAETRKEVLDGCQLTSTSEMDILVLRHSERFFGNHRSIHIWITWHDNDNANLMILLAYMLLGHPEWSKAEIEIHAAVPEDSAAEATATLEDAVTTGRIPVSPRNLKIFPTDRSIKFAKLVEEHSMDADLVILGFTMKRLAGKGVELLQRHPELGDVLFVCAHEQVTID
ncbi:MAG: amino acid permease [bacterium]|nr:amino acid permease [bacterium]